MQDAKGSKGLGRAEHILRLSKHQHGQGTIFARLAAAARLEDIYRLQSCWELSSAMIGVFQRHISKLLCVINLAITMTDLLGSKASGLSGEVELAR